jgi:hypothetical protein
MGLGRPPWADNVKSISCMLNRGNRRAPFLDKPEKDEIFEQILVALERSLIKLFSSSLMPNHRRLVLSLEVDGELGRGGQWLSLTHTQCHHAHDETASEDIGIRVD